MSNPDEGKLHGLPKHENPHTQEIVLIQVYPILPLGTFSMATAWTRTVGTHVCSCLVNHHVKYYCPQVNIRHNLKECKPSYNVFTVFLQGSFPISHTLLSLIPCSCSWYQNQNIFAWQFYQFMYQNCFLAKTSLLHLVSTERQRLLWLKQGESS